MEIRFFLPASKSRDGTGSLPDKPGCSLRQGRDRAPATKPSERCPHTAPTFSGPCKWTICVFCYLNISSPPTQIPDPHDLRHTCLWTHQTPKPRPSDIGSTRTEGTSDPPDPRTQQTLGPRTPTRRPLCLQHSGHGKQAKNQNTIMC